MKNKVIALLLTVFVYPAVARLNFDYRPDSTASPKVKLTSYSGGCEEDYMMVRNKKTGELVRKQLGGKDETSFFGDKFKPSDHTLQSGNTRTVAVACATDSPYYGCEFSLTPDQKNKYSNYFEDKIFACVDVGSGVSGSSMDVNIKCDPEVRNLSFGQAQPKIIRCYRDARKSKDDNKEMLADLDRYDKAYNALNRRTASATGR